MFRNGTQPEAYLGYDRHGSWHGRHSKGGTKIA